MTDLFQEMHEMTKDRIKWSNGVTYQDQGSLYLATYDHANECIMYEYLGTPGLKNERLSGVKRSFHQSHISLLIDSVLKIGVE